MAMQNERLNIMGIENLSEKHADIFAAVLGEYNRQAKGGVLAPTVNMLRGMVEGKAKSARTPAEKAEMRNQLLQVSALALKLLENF